MPAQGKKPRIGSLRRVQAHAEKKVREALHAHQLKNRDMRADAEKIKESDLLYKKANQIWEKALAITRKPSPRVWNEIAALREEGMRASLREQHANLQREKEIKRLIKKAIFWNTIRNFRSMPTGKAIRLATGGPRLWMRTRKIKKKRKMKK